MTGKLESSAPRPQGASKTFQLRFSLTLFAIFLLSAFGFSTGEQKKITQYIHDSWNIEQGLPQVTVNKVLQSSRGYIWLGTQEGLVRFDGVNFKTFNKNSVDQLLSNWIWTLYEDSKGSLWIGTDGGGITCMNNGRFTTITGKQGLSGDIVKAIVEDRDLNLWIGTQSGLNRYKDGRITVFTTAQGLSNDKIECILEDHAGNLWIGTDGGGVNRLDKDKNTFTYYTSKEGLSNNSVKCMVEDMDGGLWIGTDGGGLNYLKAGAFTTFTTKQGLSGNRVYSLFIDRDQDLWVGTYGAGLNRRKNGTFETFTTANGLADDFVLSLYADQERNLWIGTGTGGLQRIVDGKFTTFTTQEGLSDNIISSIYETKNRGLWIGTYSGGVNILKEGAFTALTIKDGLVNNLVRCIHEDREGHMWIGTDNGLNLLEDNTFTLFTKQHGLLDQRIWCLHEDKQGILWVGTENGLNYRKDGKFAVFAEKPGLINERIITLYEDRSGILWVGTNGGGLFRIGDKDVTSYTIENGLSCNMVWAIHEDQEGTLWLGTRGGGLNRFKDGMFTSFTTRNGFFDDIVYQILEDDAGNFWMSCNKGIFKVSKQELKDLAEKKIDTLHCISYDETDGMKSRECNGGTQPAGCKTRDGKLWFPTIYGAVMIDPGHLKINRQPPPVVIENMIADNLDFQFPLVATGDKIVLPAGTDRIEIQYTGLSFLAPNKVKFKYQLEGFDKEWLQVDNRRSAYYTKLSPGDYTFRVTAFNNDGIWNTTGTSISFSLNPYFYQTPWFYLLCVLSLLLIGFTGYRAQSGRFKKRELQLCRLVEKRTKELKELNIELENKVKERTSELLTSNRGLSEAKEIAEAANHAKSMFLTNMSHEIRTPMNAILGFAEILEKETTDERQRQLLQGISSSGRRLLGLISDILDISRIEAGEVQLHYEPVNLGSLLNEIKQIFYTKAKEKGLDFQVEAAPGLPEFVMLDNLRIRQILLNLAGNAVKFTHNGYVKLSADMRGGSYPGEKTGNSELIFSVKDTGIGIPGDQLHYVFETFSQVARKRWSEYGGTGLGLAISHRLTMMMGGEISVQSREGSGTTFQVSFKNIVGAKGEEVKGTTPAEAKGAIQFDIETIRFDNITVLVADDQELNRILLKDYLDIPGIKVLEAENGKDAVEMAKTHPPHLVLMDMEMPVMGGVEAIRKLKGDEALNNIPVIAVSGYESPDQEPVAKEAGVDAYLEKPFSQQNLILLVMRFLPNFYLAEKSPDSESYPPDSLSPGIEINLPELVSILQKDYTLRWEKISKTFFLDDIHDFSRDIRELADQYPLDILKKWGDRLSKDIQSFNMQQVTGTLENFPGIIKKIEALSVENRKKEEK